MKPCGNYRPDGGTYFVSHDDWIEHLSSKHKTSGKLCAEGPERGKSILEVVISFTHANQSQTECAQFQSPSKSSKRVDNGIKRPLGKAPESNTKKRKENVKFIGTQCLLPNDCVSYLLIPSHRSFDRRQLSINALRTRNGRAGKPKRRRQ